MIFFIFYYYLEQLDSCARIDAVFVPRRGCKSHIKGKLFDLIYFSQLKILISNYIVNDFFLSINSFPFFSYLTKKKKKEERI